MGGDVKVSDHFDSSEFDQPGRYGQPACAYPSYWLADPTRLPKLVAALEKIRAAFNAPVHVLSGYRSPQYNAAMYQQMGQVPTDSQHSQGRAADIRIDGVDPSVAHARILEMYQKGEIDIGGLGKYASFTHVDVRVGWDHLAQWEGHGS